jgi:hypothetical protein
MAIDPQHKPVIKKYLTDFFLNGKFNPDQAKMKGYEVAKIYEGQYFDNVASKISIALKLRGIERLNIFEVNDFGSRDNFEQEIETTKNAIEKLNDWKIYPQILWDCLLFDDDFKIIIFRPDTTDYSYFCGDAVFINYLTSPELTPHFTQV